MKRFLAYAFVISIFLLSACNEGTIIGNGLLENEAVGIEFEDDFALRGRTVLGDSIVTYRTNVTNQTHLLGEIDDPIFGKSSSSIYTNIGLGTSLPAFASATIDSVVLELEYDSLGFYGDRDVTHNIEVFRLSESYVRRDTIYSDVVLDAEMTPLGSRSLVPDIMGDSVRFQVRVTDADSFIYLSPRINIRLDDAYGQEILDNPSALVDDDALIATYNGLYIRSTTDGSSMIGLNFVKSGSVGSIIPKLAIYYTQGGNKLKYNFFLRDETFSSFMMDAGSSEVGNAINSFDSGEEFVYSQAMAGVNGEIHLPDLSELRGDIINSAQLVLTVSDPDDDSYPASQQFLLSRDNDDGDGRILIEDITKNGTVALSTGLGLLDGQLREVTSETGESISTVTFYITDFVRNVIEDGDFTRKLIITPIGRAESPRRTIFFGADHPVYPAKLKIAYTDI